MSNYNYKCLFLSILIGTMILWQPNTGLAGNGYLDILSEPSGVDVYINGKHVGKTPMTGLEVNAGTAVIEAKKSGFGTATKRIKIESDQILTIKIPLRKVSGTETREIVLQQDMGSLLIINQLGSVHVAIDGQNKGTGSITVNAISSGIHTLKVGQFEKQIKIYKDHKLKVKITGSGIEVLNDPEMIKRQAEIDAERRRKQVVDRDGSLIKYATGVVYDQRTNLEWAVGSSGNVTWEQAQYWAQNLSLDSGGWRLPTIDELKTLYEQGANNRNISKLLCTKGIYAYSAQHSPNSWKGARTVWVFMFEGNKVHWVPDNDTSHDDFALAVRQRNLNR